MKKFLAALLVALCGFVSLFADDIADVKAVIVKDCELAAEGDFLGAAARWMPDYREISSEGTFTYAQAQRAFVSLDGKHPEEFLLTTAMVKNGVEPNPDLAEGIHLLAQEPDFLKDYPIRAKRMADMIKAAAALELKTTKFVDIKVNEDKATAVLTYRHINGGTRRETLSLRKIDGAWRISRRVIEAE